MIEFFIIHVNTCGRVFRVVEDFKERLSGLSLDEVTRDHLIIDVQNFIFLLDFVARHSHNSFNVVEAFISWVLKDDNVTALRGFSFYKVHGVIHDPIGKR